MNFLKLIKKTQNKIDQAKTLLAVYCLLSGISLSDTELTVLAYFIVYKINNTTKELILNSQILKSEDSLKNTISKLKKVGLIKKSNISKEYSLNESIDIKAESIMAILIKIDNT